MAHIGRALALLLVAAVGATAADGEGARASAASGDRIAYLGLTGVGAKLLVVDVDSRRARRVASASRAFRPSGWSVRWSPDGKRLAFQTSTGSPQKSGVWVVDADGRNLHLLPGLDGHSWSPDGRHLAYRFRVGLSERIGVVDADGNGDRALTTRGEDGAPVWSPSGDLIAFKRQQRLHVVRPDGTGLRQLTTAQFAGHPAWSPDSTSIAFTSVGALYSIRADGTGPRRIAGGSGTRSDPSWSPDGTALVFALKRGRGSHIYTVAPDGTGLRRVPAPAGRQVGPSWSPDGSRIAYVNIDPQGRRSVWVVGLAAGGMRQLIHWPLGNPVWAPVPA